jgi:hypothetical protein
MTIMMGMRILLAFVLLLPVYAFHATPSGAASPVLAVIVNPAAGVKRLELAQLKAIFTVTEKRWPNGVPAVPFNFAPANSLRGLFDEAVLGMDTTEVAKFWIDQRIRGRARPPRHVVNEVLEGRVVAALPGAIGYVREENVPKGVVVVAFIADGKILPPSYRAQGSSR